MRGVFFSIPYLILRGLLRLAGSDGDLHDQEGRDPRPPSSGEGAVEAFQNHPLAGGPYTYLWLDPLTPRGSDRNVAALVATGVNSPGSARSWAWTW
jgi:hypothetical protein